MIHVKTSIGSGDRKMPVINDDLIIDEEMALIRAKQELAKSTYVVKSQNLEMPHDPNSGVGVVGNEFAFSTLNIFGQHLITQLTIELTGNSAKDNVVAERYGRIIL